MFRLRDEVVILDGRHDIRLTNWVEEMTECIGKIGEVIEYDTDSNDRAIYRVRVDCGGHFQTWWYDKDWVTFAEVEALEPIGNLMEMF